MEQKPKPAAKDVEEVKVKPWKKKRSHRAPELLRFEIDLKCQLSGTGPDKEGRNPEIGPKE